MRTWISKRPVISYYVLTLTYNMMVAPPAGAGLPAAVITTVVMTWGIVIVWI